ncbi:MULTISPECIES: hypothetical protein [unclassified Streptomyces]|uniref:hypothetical protein n=1 Tax=unclassified Streptomyces TaxID=2593676 RepID=UPI0029B78242|nr:hypothetical protein [Streptomyces sp. DK15]MDX2389496.1 hypothetical protein [Streptomyces sp. DK15]
MAQPSGHYVWKTPAKDPEMDTSFPPNALSREGIWNILRATGSGYLAEGPFGESIRPAHFQATESAARCPPRFAIRRPE